MALPLGPEYGVKYVLEGPAVYVVGNQITNPTFETDLAGWSLSVTSWTEGTATREELPFAGGEGSWVARLKGKKDATVTARTFSWASATPEGDVHPGQMYAFSVVTNIVDNVNLGVGIRVDWYNAGGYISSTPTSTLKTGTGIFTHSVERAVAPALANKATFVLVGNSTVASDTFDVRVDRAEFREMGQRAVFNDDTDLDYVGVLNPDESSGLDSPDVREDATDAVEADGGVHGNFYFGRRPVVLSGFVIASSVAQRNERAAKLQAATNALRDDATLKWTPTGGQEVELKLRRQQPLRITGPYLKKFQAPLVCASAQITGVGSKSAKITGIIKSQTKIAGSSTGINWNYEFGKEDENVIENFSALTADDGSYVRVPPTADPLEMVSSTGSNYGFTVPGTATVKGIKVEVERKASAGPNRIKDWRMRLVSNEVAGAIKTGENKAAAAATWSNVLTVVSYGGFNDLWGWGGLITPTLVNIAGANGFGTVYMPQRDSSFVAGDKGEIDYHKMTVFYEEASPANTVTVENEGNDKSYPILTVTGACVNPTIENVSTGLKIKINVTVGAGETLVIDTKNKTVRLNGATNVYKNFDFVNSEWWSLGPGPNIIKFTLDSGDTAAALNIDYRNAWL